MDVDQIEALEAQWQEEPPVNLVVAAYLGVTSKDKKRGKVGRNGRALRLSEGGAEKLLEMFPGGVIRG